MTQPLTGLPERWEDWIGPDEMLLWKGALQREGRLRLPQVGMALFGLAFLFIGVVTATVGLNRSLGSHGAADIAIGRILIVMSVPFLWVGLALMFGPHLAVRLAHQRVRYAITNSRIYVATRWWQPKLESHPVHPDAVAELINDGPVGIVRLQLGLKHDSDGDAVPRYIKLESRADAAQVYQLLQRLQKDLK